MNILNEYLERRRQARQEEEAKRDLEATSPEEVLESLDSNTAHTADLIGTQIEESKKQSSSVLDSLDLIGKTLEHDTKEAEVDKKVTLAHQVKTEVHLSKALSDVNDTLKEIASSNKKVEKYLRPELNSKDDTYTKRKGDAETVAKEKKKEEKKPLTNNQNGVGGYLVDLISDLFDFGGGKEKGRGARGRGRAGRGARMPRAGRAGRFGRMLNAGKSAIGSIGEFFSKKVLPAASERLSTARAAAKPMLERTAQAARPAATKVAELFGKTKDAVKPTIARATEAAKPVVTRMADASKPILQRAAEASKTTVDVVKSGASKGASFFSKAVNALKPSATGVADATAIGTKAATSVIPKAVGGIAAGTAVAAAPSVVGSLAESATAVAPKAVGGVAEGAAAAAPKALGSIGGIAEGASKAAPGLLSKGGRLLGRAATPLAIGMSAYDIYATEKDDTLTRDQKNVRHAGNAGGMAGGMAGAAAGAAMGSVVPVIGTAIGGVVGGIAGYYGGEKIGSTLMSGYQSARDYLTGEPSKSGKVEPKTGAKINGKVAVTGEPKKEEKSALGTAGMALLSAVSPVTALAMTAKSALTTDTPKPEAKKEVKTKGASSDLLSSKNLGMAAAASVIPGGAILAPVAAKISDMFQSQTLDSKKAVTDGLVPGLKNVSSSFNTASTRLQTSVADSNQAMTTSVEKSTSLMDRTLTMFSTGLSDTLDTMKNAGASVKRGAQAAWAGAKAAVKQTGEAVSSTASAVKAGWKENGVSGAVKGGVKAAKEGFSGIVDNTLGAVSEKFESGGRGVGTISTGLGDAGGVSYGKHQLASKNKSMDKFLASAEAAPIAAKFQGLTPGTKEFNDKYKEVTSGADKDVMEKAQQAYMQRTHFEPQAAKLKQELGLDVSKEGRAVQEAVFSTATQYGANSSVISKALAGKDLSKMSDADKVKAIQDYKAANVDKNFASSSAGVKASVARRIEQERDVLTSIANDPKLNKSAAKTGEESTDLSLTKKVDAKSDKSKVAKTEPKVETKTAKTETKADKVEVAKTEPKTTPVKRALTEETAKTEPEKSVDAKPEMIAQVAKAVVTESVGSGSTASEDSVSNKGSDSDSDKPKKKKEKKDEDDKTPKINVQQVASTGSAGGAVPDVRSKVQAVGNAVPESVERATADTQQYTPVTSVMQSFGQKFDPASVLNSARSAVDQPIQVGSSQIGNTANQLTSQIANVFQAPMNLLNQGSSVAQQLSSAAAPISISGYQAPLPKVAASLPAEMAPVQVMNAQDMKANVPQESSPSPASLTNAFDTAIPKLDNIPLQITDLGLILLNVGHI